MKMLGKTVLDALLMYARDNKCKTCECLQGFLVQLEIDMEELSESIDALKIPACELHGCLGCTPCPPGELFTKYLLDGLDDSRNKRT